MTRCSFKSLRYGLLMEIPTLSGNELKLLEVLVKGQPMAGAALVRCTGLPRTSVYSTLYRMADTKRVVRTTSSGGYRATALGRKAYKKAIGQ